MPVSNEFVNTTPAALGRGAVRGSFFFFPLPLSLGSFLSSCLLSFLLLSFVPTASLSPFLSLFFPFHLPLLCPGICACPCLSVLLPLTVFLCLSDSLFHSPCLSNAIWFTPVWSSVVCLPSFVCLFLSVGLSFPPSVSSPSLTTGQSASLPLCLLVVLSLPVCLSPCSSFCLSLFVFLSLFVHLSLPDHLSLSLLVFAFFLYCSLCCVLFYKLSLLLTVALPYLLSVPDSLSLPCSLSVTCSVSVTNLSLILLQNRVIADICCTWGAQTAQRCPGCQRSTSEIVDIFEGNIAILDICWKLLKLQVLGSSQF